MSRFPNERGEVLVARNSPLPQGSGEGIPYQFEFEGATTAVHVSTKVYDEDGRDVTTEVTAGSPSQSGNVVTIEKLENLKPGQVYRIVVVATVDAVQTRQAVGDLIAFDPRKV